MRTLRSSACAVLVAAVGLTPGVPAARAAQAPLPSPKVTALLRAAAPPSSLVHSRATGERHVYIHVDGSPESAAPLLELQGAHVERVSKELGLVQAWVAPEQLDAVAALSFVRKITPPSYAVTRAGSVMTEGDAIEHSDQIRALGYDGTGVKVGIIADGIDSLAVCQSTADCPQVQIVGGQSGSGDEGTATIQLVHDVAPGATIGFCSGGQDNGVTTADMVACAGTLVSDFGANVIVDDLGFPAEPYFEDGGVAKAVAAAVSSGVLWATAAGNDALKHYQGLYVDNGDPFHLHNFQGGHVTMDVDVRPGGSNVFFEWSNLFDAATDKYRICLTDSDATNATVCGDAILGDNVPLGVLNLPCDGPDHCTDYVLVTKDSGAPQTLEMFFDRAKPMSYGTAADSIYGHPCVPGVVSVVAIDAADPNHDTAEAFDSQGPCTILFPEAETRAKPDVSAVDDVSIVDANGHPAKFTGTSAAAPHVAGIAALFYQAFPGVSNANIARALSKSAIDIGDPGPDLVFGAGFVDAFASLDLLDAPPQSVIDSPASDTTVVAPGSSVEFTGTCTDPDQSSGLEAHWDFGASGVAPSSVTDPGPVFFHDTGTFTVTFTCTDSFKNPDPSPATRTVIVGVPPDGTIDDPPADLTVLTGEPVNFASSCTDPDGSGPFTHHWTFGARSGVPDSTAEDPGEVSFPNAGVFTVSYTCIDSSGASDPTPATRTITVNAAPESAIDQPLADVTISRGGAVTFQGTCTDPSDPNGLSATWSFGSGSGIPDAVVTSPGVVTFPNAGTFTVSFTCKDSHGIPDPSPATRTVTVQGKKSSGGGGCSVASERDGGSAALGFGALVAMAVTRRARRRLLARSE